MAERGWKNPAREKRVITDLGEDAAARTVKNAATGEVVSVLPRYGVWGRAGRRNAEVLETSDDLARLKHDHGVDAGPIPMGPGWMDNVTL